MSASSARSPRQPAAQLLVRRPADNVAVAVADGMRAGMEVSGAFLEGAETFRIVLADDIPFGHKVALQDIKAGDLVLKHGAEIGAATAPISRGDLVHVHNMATRRG